MSNAPISGDLVPAAEVADLGADRAASLEAIRRTKNNQQMYILQKMQKLFVVMVAGISLWGCQSRDYAVQKEFVASCWPFSDSLAFAYSPVSDSLGLEIGLELEDVYDYSNLYLRLHILFPSGKDTLIHHSQTFIDPLGHWLIERKGGRYPLVFSSFSGLPAPEQGSYQLSLFQDMREDTLCGVRRVWVKK